MMKRRIFFALLLTPILFIIPKKKSKTRIFGGGIHRLTDFGNYAHIYPCNISANLGRTEIWELGRQKPYYIY